jgi:hypothetical protein
LDVLKTRLQVQRISSTTRVGIIGGLSAIVKAEGAKGLYRGLTPTLMALLPNWAVYFSVYGRLKTVLTTRQGGWGCRPGSTRAAAQQSPLSAAACGSRLARVGAVCCCANSGQWLHTATGFAGWGAPRAVKAGVLHHGGGGGA